MFVVTFAVLAVSVHTARGQLLVTNSSSKLDFFVFVELSPGADCYVVNGSRNCSRTPPTPNWTMHGLWPSSYTESDNPEYCNTSATFDVTKLKALLPQLMRIWPTLERPSDWDKYCSRNVTEYLWCHEWMKHGTCATSIHELSTMNGFFSTVLSMFEKKMDYDTFVLAKHGIVPSLTHSYQLKEFVSAFANTWSVHPVLRCDWKSEHQVLESISTCLSRTFSPMNCPHYVYDKKKCSSRHPIYYFPS